MKMKFSNLKNLEEFIEMKDDKMIRGILKYKHITRWQMLLQKLN